LIALILIGLFAGVITYVLGSVNTTYDVEYSNTSLAAFEKLDNMSADIKQIKEDSINMEQANPLDIIGAYFTAGYKTLRTSAESFAVFEIMVGSTFDKFGLDSKMGSMFKGALVAIMIVLIFVGIILAAVLKRDL